MSSHPLSFSQRDLSWNIYSAFQATLRIRCAATTLIRVLRPRTQKIYLELLPEIKLADPSTFPSSTTGNAGGRSVTLPSCSSRLSAAPIATARCACLNC